MKFCIIGGGVSGGLLNRTLTELGHDLTVFDKSSFQMRSGFGFLLLPNGIAGLKELGVWKDVEPYCLRIRKVNFINTSGDLTNQIDFEEVYSISRFKFLEALSNMSTRVAEDLVKLSENGDFLIGDNTNISTKEFDGILGSDGVHSNTRKHLNNNAENQETATYEVMGVVKSDFLYNMLGNELHKYAIADNGLSMGILPLKDGEIIWYLQVNSIDHGVPNRDRESLIKFLKEKVGDCENPMIQALLNSNIETTYVWQGRTLKNVSCLAKENIFLFGDAAHLFLPFTSQGTNSAIVDVALFVQLLKSGKALPEFAHQYSVERLAETNAMVQSGIEMMHDFCFTDFSEVAAKIPITILK
jgi:2-polyprenyl-6-methoxyphenol hydroxylase-like FAD-dependent oxidoreductase